MLNIKTTAEDKTSVKLLMDITTFFLPHCWQQLTLYRTVWMEPGGSFFFSLMCSGSVHCTEPYALVLCLERGPSAQSDPARVLHSTCAQQEACCKGEDSWVCLALLLTNEERHGSKTCDNGGGGDHFSSLTHPFVPSSTLWSLKNCSNRILVGMTWWAGAYLNKISYL